VRPHRRGDSHARTCHSAMTTRATRVPASLARGWAGVLLGGLVAGLLDITYAFIILGLRGRSPLWVLQSVASGLLGSAAFDSGALAGVLGLFCHFVVALGASAVYFLAARHLAVLREHPAWSGAAFGILVYLFMNFVVIPLSAYPLKVSYPPRVLIRGFLAHALLVGIPIALSVRGLSFRQARRADA